MLKSHLIIKGLKMKNALMIFFILFFTACSSTMQPNGTGYNINGTYDEKKIDSNSFKNFKEVMRINPKCEPCDNGSGSSITINGVDYSSDISLSCCKNVRKIDTGLALKKVYIHRVNDLREDQKIVRIQGKDKQFQDMHMNKRADYMFYLLLKQELKERGIIVLEERSSPYVMKLDFDFLGLQSYYSPSSAHLASNLYGFLMLKDINKTKRYKISTTQDVRKFQTNNPDDFGVYLDLLIRQAANKVAEEISKF